MTRLVLAGLVGRSPDWLKKIENGTRRLNSLPMLVRISQVLDVPDLAELAGTDHPAPVEAWDGEVHHVVPAIRQAMREVSFPLPDDRLATTPDHLQQTVRRLWILWHTSAHQRTDVGRELPSLIRQAHATIRRHDGEDRRRARAATGDLYRLVQRLLAHISERELHALAVERGRAMSEDADTPLSLALAAWSSSVSLCAAGHYDDAAQLADAGVGYLSPLLNSGARSGQVIGTLGALQLEAAAAHGLAGRQGDAFRLLDAAHATASRMPAKAWHEQSGFERSGVQILSVIVASCLHRYGDALTQAARIAPDSPPSVVRSSRLLLEEAHAHTQKTDYDSAVRALTAAADTSTEAVALIPWARELADELVANTSGGIRMEATTLAARLKSVR